MGHPHTFQFKMIGVGNEQWGPQYIERYKVIYKSNQGEISMHGKYCVPVSARSQMASYLTMPTRS